MNFIFLRNLCSLFTTAILVTLAGGLSAQANTIESDSAIAANQSQATPIIAQRDVDRGIDRDIDIEPGRETRSGSSYVGVGGNIGLSGDSALGDAAFAVFSKIGLTNSFSARPSAVINDNAVFLLPVTVDFTGDQVTSEQLMIAPYLGAGVAISTGEDSNVSGLITGGLDVPLSSQFTANTSTNVSFVDNTDVGLQIGVGYNF
jgi:hypothetical protein